jgi:RNA polymerase sigma-70 factor (ECF subfamily)
MEAALDSINEDQAHTIWLHHVADVSVADIALLTGVKVGTVLSRLHRGREGLRKGLDTERKKGVN